VLAFIGNVDTAFAVINPEKEAILNKFILRHTSGEPRMTICHRNLDSWAELMEFLQNSYIEKRSFFSMLLSFLKLGKENMRG
jgi:hypothetical protein